MTDLRRIAVMTSGGDAPGMNAAIRAVVRAATYHKLTVKGIIRGYDGMIKGEFVDMDSRKVGNIIHRGGTILKTARSERFRTPEGRAEAYEQLVANDIEAVVVIGGNGTFTGADIFMKEYPSIPFIGLPGTIDNDLYGTDLTIGFDTSVNTAIDAIDRIRDTADSHDRLFFVEVMGRHAGFIALHATIGGGAGTVLLPEIETTNEQLIEMLNKSAKRGKLFNIVVVAEGNKHGNAYTVAEQVKKHFTASEIKVAVIGHLQRGGSPTALDRILASRLGVSAVERLLAGGSGEMVGMASNEVVYVPFADAIYKEKKLNENMRKLAEILAV